MEISKHTLALMLRRNGNALGDAAKALGDHIVWKPLDKGRSGLDQVLECAGFAFLTKQIFEAQAMIPIDFAQLEAMKAEYDTPEKALGLLDQTFEELANAIEAFPDAKMGEKLVLPFMNNAERSFTEIAMMTHWNTVYHEGQINYIETLMTP